MIWNDRIDNRHDDSHQNWDGKAGLNTLVKPILILLSLPLNIMTLGLFSFVISAGMLQPIRVLIDIMIWNDRIDNRHDDSHQNWDGKAGKAKTP
jgi:hypothetical protein